MKTFLFCHILLSLMSFHTSLTFYLLWNTKDVYQNAHAALFHVMKVNDAHRLKNDKKAP